MIFIKEFDLYLNPDKIACIWYTTDLREILYLNWVTTGGCQISLNRSGLSKEDKNAIKLQLKEAFGEKIKQNK